MVTRKPMGKTRTDATASSDLTVILLKHASGLGIEIEGVCKEVGLDLSTVEEQGARISANTFNGLWEAVALRSGAYPAPIRVVEAEELTRDLWLGDAER